MSGVMVSYPKTSTGLTSQVLTTPWVALVLAVALGLFASLPTVAQELPPEFQLSLTNPGARSMGFGGAFSAVADDATAAWINPAGLVQLARPEVSFETRARFTYKRNDKDDSLDILHASSLSFISVVYPWKKFSFAFNTHRSASFKLDEKDSTLKSSPWQSSRATGATSTLSELNVLRYALSVGYRPFEAICIGIGVSRFNANIKLGKTDASGASTPSEKLNRSSWGINGGILLRLGEQIRLGGFYRQGPKFDLPSLMQPQSTNLSKWRASRLLTDETTFKMPNIYGGGIAYRSKAGAFLLAGEWDRVEYSSLLQANRMPNVSSGKLVLKDATEVHLGGEYAFLQNSPVIAVRFGIWRDPDHQIRYYGSDPEMAARYPRGESMIRYAIGTGFAFKRAQIDLGIDAGEGVFEASFSVIVHF